MSDPATPTEARLTKFSPALKTRASRLIGRKLRVLVGSSDLVQETLMVAVRRRATIAGMPSRQLLDWLLQVMQFRVMRYLRKHRRELARRDGDVGAIDPPRPSSAISLKPLGRGELREGLAGMVATLADGEERRGLVLYYMEGRTTAEIAVAFEKSPGAVRAMRQRALKRLRDRFGGIEP